MPHLQENSKPPACRYRQKLPPQVELILSALETAQHNIPNRRAHRRHVYRVQAAMRFFSDPPSSLAWQLYTRDVHARGLGFLSPRRLPLGHGGILELPHPEEGIVRVDCTLIRCREAAPGWFEGCLYFNREQSALTDIFESAVGELATLSS